MGYPFRDALLSFLKGDTSARTWSLTMEKYRENLPDQMFYCMMNLISSHDVPRAITMLAGAPDPGTREAQKELHLTKHMKSRGSALMKMAFALQMTYPGCPCTYYGDEIGMDGYRDPFNRRTYPWENESSWQKNILSSYRELSSLRSKYEVLRCGEIKILHAEGDDLIFERTLDEQGRDHFGKVCSGPKKVLCIMNRSDKMKMLVRLDEHALPSSVEHIPEIFAGNGETGCRVIGAEQIGEIVEIHPLSAIICILS